MIVSYVTCETEYQEGAVSGAQICSCGTFAIGLCVECSRPVCGQHSAMLEERRLCGTHYQERSNSIREAKAATERKAAEERSQRVASEPKPRWINASEAPARLRAAGVRSVDIWDYVGGHYRTWYGRMKWDSMRHTRVGSGWLIGELGWSHPERWNMGEGTMSILTVLIDPGDWSNTKWQFVAPVHLAHGEYTLMATDFTANFGGTTSKHVSERILQLLGE